MAVTAGAVSFDGVAPASDAHASAEGGASPSSGSPSPKRVSRPPQLLLSPSSAKPVSLERLARRLGDGVEASVLREATVLDLERRRLSDAYGIALAELLHASTVLHTLSVADNALTDRAGVTLAAAIQHSRSLRTFSAARNGLGDGTANALAEVLEHNATLTSLELSGNTFSSRAVRALARSLERNSTLREFRLASAHVADGAGAHFGAALARNLALESLCLGGNALRDGGCAEIARALAANGALTELDLSDNNAGPRTAEELASALQRAECRLERLLLGGNRMGDAAGRVLAGALPAATRLRVLHLGANNLADASGAALAEALGASGGSALAELHVPNNALSDRTGVELATALRENRALVLLNLSGNMLSDVSGVALGDALATDAPSAHEASAAAAVAALRSAAAAGRRRSSYGSAHFGGRARSGHYGPADGGPKRPRSPQRGGALNQPRSPNGRAPAHASHASPAHAHAAHAHAHAQPPQPQQPAEADGGGPDGGGGAAAAAPPPTGPPLAELRLERNGLTDATGVELARALTCSQTLISLDLDDNELTDASGVALARAVMGRALSGRPPVVSLALSSNELSDATGEELAAALMADGCGLRTLALGEANLTDRAGGALARALAANQTLRTLVLAGTKLTDASGVALGRALRANATLRVLRAEGNALRERSAAEIAAALASGGGRALTALNLEGNPPGFARAMRAALLLLRQSEEEDGGEEAAADEPRLPTPAAASQPAAGSVPSPRMVAAAAPPPDNAPPPPPPAPPLPPPLHRAPTVGAADEPGARGAATAAPAHPPAASELAVRRQGAAIFLSWEAPFDVAAYHKRLVLAARASSVDDYDESMFDFLLDSYAASSAAGGAGGSTRGLLSAGVGEGASEAVKAAGVDAAHWLCGLDGDDQLASAARLVAYSVACTGTAQFALEGSIACTALARRRREEWGQSAADECAHAARLVELGICSAELALSAAAAASGGGGAGGGGGASGGGGGSAPSRGTGAALSLAPSARQPAGWEGQWPLLERAAEGGCTILLSYPPVQRAHIRALGGSVREAAGQALSMASALRESEFSTQRRAWAVWLASPLAVLAAQPLLAAVLVLAPDASPLLSSALRVQFKSGRVKNKYDSRGSRPLAYSTSLLLVDAPIVKLTLHWLMGCVLVWLCATLPPVDDTAAMAMVERARAAADDDGDDDARRGALRPPAQADRTGAPDGAPGGAGLLPIELTEERLWTSAALACVAGAILVELEELMRDGRNPLTALRRYVSDEFNLFEIGGLLLAAVALLLRLAPPGDDSLAQDAPASSQVMSVAVLGLTIRLMRALYLSTELGPFTLMVFRMLQDVGRIVGIMLPLLCAFAVALHVLLKEIASTQMGEGCSTLGDPEAQQELHEDYGHSAESALVVLIEVVFGMADTRLDCLRQSPVGWLSWVLMVTFAIVMVVLMLNVIIAAMAKTFDSIHDHLDVHAKFVKAKLIQSAARLPPAPPPFNLLGLPSRVAVSLWRCRRRLRAPRAASGAPASAEPERRRESVETSPRAGPKRGRLEPGAGGVGSTSRPSALLEEWMSQLEAEAREYMGANLAEADADERWRMRMTRRHVRLEESMAAVEGSLGEVVAALERIEARESATSTAATPRRASAATAASGHGRGPRDSGETTSSEVSVRLGDAGVSRARGAAHEADDADPSLTA